MDNKKESILFIINPLSGTSQKKTLTKRIAASLNLEKYSPSYVFTRSSEEASTTIQENINKGVQSFVSVGGDGTLNTVASQLINTNCKLGILPLGSGNGLAKHLRIYSFEEAMQIINEGHYTRIDTGSANGKPFFNVGGVGFSGTISDAFERKRKRGLLGYAITSLKHLIRYEPLLMEIQLDHQKIVGKFWSVEVANGSHLGYKFKIAPMANFQDGVFEVLLVEVGPRWKYPFLMLKMYQGKILENEMIKHFRSKSVSIITFDKRPIHLDGDGKDLGKKVSFGIIPKSLNVYSNNRYEQEK